MTQVELSNMLCVSHQAVSKWENGDCLPDIEVILKLANIFHMSVEELLLIDQASHNQDPIGEDNDPDHSESSIRLKELEWDDVLDAIKPQASKPSYDTWFKYTSANLEANTYVIYSPNKFSSEWLYRNYSTLIIETIESLIGHSQFNTEFRATVPSIRHQISERARLNKDWDQLG